MDDSYLGAECPDGKAGRASESKFTIVASFSFNVDGHPIHPMFISVNGFSSEAIAVWAKRHLALSSLLLSDGLAWFRAVTTANCHPKAVFTGGKHSNDLPQFR
jgi:hypothetical protein